MPPIQAGKYPVQSSPETIEVINLPSVRKVKSNYQMSFFNLVHIYFYREVNLNLTT